MAGRVGVSARTCERVKFILKEGTEEQIEELRQGGSGDRDDEEKSDGGLKPGAS